MGKNNKNNPNGGIKGSAKSGNKNNPNGGIKGSAKSGNNNKNKKNNPNGGIKGSAKASGSASQTIANIISGGGGSSSSSGGGKASQAVFNVLNKKNNNKNKNNKNNKKNNKSNNNNNKNNKSNKKVDNLKAKVNALQATIAGYENTPAANPVDTTLLDSYFSGIQESINANNQSNQDTLSSLLDAINTQNSNVSDSYMEDPVEAEVDEEEEDKPIEPPRPVFPDMPYSEWDFNYGQKPSEETAYEYPGFPGLTTPSENQPSDNVGQTFNVDNLTLGDTAKKIETDDLDEEEKSKLKVFEEIMKNTSSDALSAPETFQNVILNV